MTMLISPAIEAEETFKWSEVRRGLFNVQIWLTSTTYFALLSGVYSFGLFVSIFLFSTPLYRAASFVLTG